MFSGLPRKRTYLPILELLPPPASRECCHRGLARRLVAVRWRARYAAAGGGGGFGGLGGGGFGGLGGGMEQLISGLMRRRRAPTQMQLRESHENLHCRTARFRGGGSDLLL